MGTVVRLKVRRYALDVPRIACTRNRRPCLPSRSLRLSCLFVFRVFFRRISWRGSLSSRGLYFSLGKCEAFASPCASLWVIARLSILSDVAIAPWFSSFSSLAFHLSSFVSLCAHLSTSAHQPASAAHPPELPLAVYVRLPSPAGTPSSTACVIVVKLPLGEEERERAASLR